MFLYQNFYMVDAGRVIKKIPRGGSFETTSLGKLAADSVYIDEYGLYGEIIAIPTITEYQTFGADIITIDDINKTVTVSKEVVPLPLNEIISILKKKGERLTTIHIQNVVEAYNTAHDLSFRDVHSCANYKDAVGYTHQQFCIDVWNFNIQVWETLRNTIMPGIDFANPPTEAEFIAMLPVYNGTV